MVVHCYRLSGTVLFSVVKIINTMSVAYDLPRLWGRALSQPILDRSVHLHPPGAVGEVSHCRRQVQRGGTVSVTGLDTGPGT